MSSSSKTPIESVDQSKTLESTQSPIQESSDPPPMDTINPDQETLQNPEVNSNSEEEEEEEEGECGFCLFMKGGDCKDNFVSWEKCIEDAEKNKEDIVDKCFEVTAALKKCMEAHPDYYEPILRAEKAAEAEAVEELEKQKEKDKEKQAGVIQELESDKEKVKEDEKA